MISRPTSIGLKKSLCERIISFTKFQLRQQITKDKKSLPAWYSSLALLLQKKTGKPNSFMFSPKSTTVLTAFLLQQDGNPQKSFTAKRRMVFRRSFCCFYVLGDGNVERVFEDGIWNPCRCVWQSFDWLVANSFKMGQCKMSVIPAWMRTTFFTQPIFYLQYPNKNHHSWLMLPKS